MLRVPFIKPEDIEQKAIETLRQHTPGTVPVDIDTIIEFGFGMDIRPIPGLRGRVSGEGFTLRDWSAIYYDDSQPSVRVRFTLAHELGHVVLHRSFIDALPPTPTVEAWIKLYLDLPPGAFNYMEKQASMFAANLLVPRSLLAAEFEKHFPAMQPLADEARRNGFRRSDYLDYMLGAMATRIAPSFDVSVEMAENRLKNTGLVNDLP